MNNKQEKTISSMLMNNIHYLNKRPILTLCLLAVIITDFIWLNYANFFSSGILTYFEYRPFEAGFIVFIAISVMVFLVKKVDR